MGNIAKGYVAAIMLIALAACATSRRETPRPAPPPPSGALQASYAAGIAYHNNGEFARAIERLRTVWTQDRRYKQVKSYLSRSYLMAGLEHYAEQRYDRAVEMWKSVLEVDPANQKAKRYLARARDEARRREEMDSG